MSARRIPEPRDIVQLYRVLLRHSSASVLHATPARHNLRWIFNNQMDAWMKRSQESATATQDKQAEWDEFAHRYLRTLRMLKKSSTTIGVPHKLTSNLANMRYHSDPPQKVQRRSSAIGTPNPLSQSTPAFLAGRKGRSQAEIQRLYALDAFGETVTMAEASAGLFLGRLKPREVLPQD